MEKAREIFQQCYFLLPSGSAYIVASNFPRTYFRRLYLIFLLLRKINNTLLPPLASSSSCIAPSFNKIQGYINKVAWENEMLFNCLFILRKQKFRNSDYKPSRQTRKIVIKSKHQKLFGFFLCLLSKREKIFLIVLLESWKFIKNSFSKV